MPTRARAKSAWRDMDIILLAKIVKMEADIRAAQVELDAVGMMVENKRGTQMPNPLICVVRDRLSCDSKEGERSARRRLGSMRHALGKGSLRWNSRSLRV